MKKTALSIAAILLTGTAAAAQDAIIHAGQIVDTRAGRILTDQYIAVEDGMITDVGRWQDRPESEGDIIDLSDKTVLPGMTDSHMSI